MQTPGSLPRSWVWLGEVENLRLKDPKGALEGNGEARVGPQLSWRPPPAPPAAPNSSGRAEQVCFQPNSVAHVVLGGRLLLAPGSQASPPSVCLRQASGLL